MAEYQKSSGVSGSWLKAADVVSGTKAKLVSECVPSESVWEGKTIKNNVAKVRLQGDVGEAKNVNVNKPSINALVDAFGSDSNGWIGKLLTAHTEKMLVGGKRVTALYFIPEGYEIKEDEGGYLVIEKIGKVEPPAAAARTSEPADDYVPNPDDIPF
jgi:hypothetical protein